MSQAFDTVNHERLWSKLRKLGVSTKIINTMAAIYKGARAKVRTNYDISDTFQIQKGILQGETVSPVLWNMYLEDLIETLHSSDTMPIKLIEGDIHALLYADDIIILAYTEGELQKKVEILAKYLKENNLRVNLTKTEYMIFSRRRVRRDINLTWEETKIQRARTYTYLGVPFNETLNLSLVKDHFFTKAKRAIGDLQCIIFKSKMNNLECILSLYNSLIRSVVSYCAPIWGVKFIHEFEHVRIRFLKTLFLLPKLTPHWFVRLELDLRNSEIFMIQSVLKFIFRLSSKNQDSLVYKAYKSAKAIQENNKSWYKQVKNILCKSNCVHLLDIQDENVSLACKNRIVTKELSCIEFNTISKDISDMRNSQFFNLYKQNKTHCLREEYLYDNYTWKAKQLILQLKLGLSHITFKGKVTKLRSLEKMYKNVEDDKCILCGNGAENVYHVIFVCIHYKPEREKYLNRIIKFTNNNYDENNYLQLFNKLEKPDSLNLMYFFNSANHRRQIYLNEINASENI